MVSEERTCCTGLLVRLTKLSYRFEPLSGETLLTRAVSLQRAKLDSVKESVQR